MKIAPLSTQDPWFPQILASRGIWSETLADVPVEALVNMEHVTVQHHGHDRNYRPFLHLGSQLEAVEIPTVQMPYGIDRLEYEKNAGPRVDAFYEFDDEQLASLVAKGYFTDDFAPPADMVGIQWVLPVKADFVVVAPEGTDQPPLVFMSIVDRSSLRFDTATSGYELAQYFPDRSDEERLSPLEEERRREQQDDTLRTYRGRMNDLFANVPLDAYQGGFDRSLADPQLAAAQPAVPARAFDHLIEQATAKQEAARAELDAVQGADLSTPEGVYQHQVKPSLDAKAPDLAVEAIIEAGASFDISKEDDGTLVSDDYSAEEDLQTAEARTRRDARLRDQAAAVRESEGVNDMFADDEEHGQGLG